MVSKLREEECQDTNSELKHQFACWLDTIWSAVGTISKSTSKVYSFYDDIFIIMFTLLVSRSDTEEENTKE